MKKLFAALILTACASMLHADSYDGNLMPLTPNYMTQSQNYGRSYSYSSDFNYNPSQAPGYSYGQQVPGYGYGQRQFNPNPTNYGAGDYYGNYGQSYYGPREPTGRCVQGCNPRTGRSDFPYQGMQQGPQGPYQAGQRPYPEGQYQAYPQGPFQSGQYSQQFQGQAYGPMQQGQAYDQRQAFGPAAPGARSDEKQVTSQEVQDSLRSMFSSKYNNVNATVNNGYVTLQGTVASQEDKNDLEQKVRKMDGVKAVNNQVVVQPSQKGQASSSYTQNPAQNPNPRSSSSFQGRQDDRYQTTPDQTRNY